MYMARLNIRGFGALQDRTYELSDGLCVIYGPNEAGKSTLLGFIRGVLFGFPHRNQQERRYEPAGGGVYGGSIVLRDSQGREIRVERFGSPEGGRVRSASGSVRVTLPSGRSGGEDLLAPLLGGLSGDLFRSLFAFGLEELQEIRTLQSGELGSYLHQAGMGGGRPIAAAEKKLAEEMDKLFRPRGRNQELHQVLQELEKSEAGIRGARAQLERFNRIGGELIQLEEQLQAADGSLRSVRLERGWQELCLQARDRWVKGLELQREIAELEVQRSLLRRDGSGPFPAGGLQRLELLLQETEAVRIEANRLTGKLEQLQAGLEALQPRAGMLELQAELDSMLEEVGAYQEWKQAADRHGAETERLELQLARLLDEIGPGWTAERLAGFPTHLAEREQLRAMKQRLEQAVLEREESEFQAERLQKLADSAQRQVGQLEAEAAAVTGRAADFRLMDAEGRLHVEVQHSQGLVPGSRPGSPAEPRKRVQQYRELRLEVKHAEERLEELREEAGDWLPAGSSRSFALRAAWLALACLFFGGLGLYGLLQGRLPEAAALAALAAALLLSAFALRRSAPAGAAAAGRRGGRRGTARLRGRLPGAALHARKEKAMQAELAALQREEAALRQELERLFPSPAPDWAGEDQGAAAEAAPAAGVGAGPDASDGGGAPGLAAAMSRRLDGWERQLELLEQAADRWRLADQRLFAAREEAGRRQQELEEAGERVRQLEERYARARREWADWLRRRSLPEEASPEAAGEIVRLAEQGKPLLEQLERARTECGSARRQRDRFEVRAGRLLLAAGLTPEGEAVLSLKQVKAMIEQEKRLAEERKLKQEQRIGLIEELRIVQDKQSGLEEQLLLLLRQAGAADAEDFRRLASLEERLDKLREERRALETVLEAWAGERGLAELCRALERQDPLQQEAAVGQLAAEEAELEEERSRLIDLRGRLRQEQSVLESAEELSDLLLRRQELQTRVRQLAGRWAALSISAELFRRTKAVYEQERQPAVLRRAGGYFSTMSGGRYSGIMAPLGESRLLVRSREGEVLYSSQLSRGTAEQLYLAMRFALADEAGSLSSMPMIMDDILVNFDASRLCGAGRVIGQLANNRQVLMLTCHTHVRDALQETAGVQTSIELS